MTARDDALAALQREEYIGDAVYVSFDGFSIWLRTGDSQDQRICLEPEVLAALDKYRKALAERIEAFKAMP